MYMVDVIPLGRKIPHDSLSYLAKHPYTFGDIVSIPLQHTILHGLVIASSPLSEKKQYIKSLGYRLRHLKESNDPKKERQKVLFSPFYLNIIQSLASFYLMHPAQFILRTTPAFLLKGEEYPRKHDFSPQEHLALTVQEAPLHERLTRHLQAWKKASKRGNSLHLIVPTQGDVLFLKDTFLQLDPSLKPSLVTLHGKSTSAQKKKVWEQLTQNEPLLLISTPLFLDIPLPRKEKMVLEFYQSDAYTQSVSPHLDMRVVIESYAQQAQLPVTISDGIILKQGSILWEKVHEQKVHAHLFENTQLITYNDRERKKSDEERIRELTRHQQEESFLFNETMEKALFRAVEKKKKVFLYAPKKYFASQLICMDCGNTVKNPKTGGRIIYKKEGDRFFFVDALTKEVFDAFDTCPVCGSWRLKSLGIGSERLFAFVEEKFPRTPSLLIDTEHTRKPSLLKKALSAIQRENHYIIVGTKLALPHMRKLDIEESFIASLDPLLFIPSPQHEEKFLYDAQTISSFSQRVFLQTRLRKKHSSRQQTNAKKMKSHVSLFQKKLFAKLAEKVQQSLGAQVLHLASEDFPLWNFFEGGEEARAYFFKKNRKTTFMFIRFATKHNALSFLQRLQQMQERDELQQQITFFSSRKHPALFIFLSRKLWNERTQDRLLKNLLRKASYHEIFVSF